MKQTIKEAALDYIYSERERNFYAANRKLTLRVYNQDVDVESIWKDDDKVYLHCGCKEFEGDIDIESLSEENQERVREVLQCVNEDQARKKDKLLKETIVLLAADIYKTIYDRDDCGGWGDASDDIIRYAEQFEQELNWQENDDRDYIVELEKFEQKVLDELNK